MSIRVIISWVVTVSLMGMIASAMAHRAPGSLTNIKWNETSKRTEFVHRLHVHDAEVGVSASLGMSGLSVGKIEDRAHIALYVEEHFQVRSGDRSLPLELVGAELSGDFILVYQEYPGRLPETVLIRDNILRDAFPRQVNQVNIEDSGAIHSLVYSEDVDWLAYSFVE